MQSSDYIKDKNVLKAMNKQGLIVWPAERDDDRFCYVNNAKDEKGHDIDSFVYKGNEYRLSYVSGCFYPYVFLQIRK